MIRAVIIDDERNSRDIISLMLQRYCPDIEAVAQAGNCREGIAQIREQRPQLVFLDLEMPDGTGFDVLTGAYDSTFETIFVTAFEKRYLHTIRFSEVELILKPIDRESLQQAVQAIRQRLGSPARQERYDVLLHNFGKTTRDVHQIVIPLSGGGEFVASVENIAYVEGVTDKTLFSLSNGDLLQSRRPFRYYTELFAGMRFYQVNNHQMVQLPHIHHIDHERLQLHLHNQSVLDITERRKRELASVWRQQA